MVRLVWEGRDKKREKREIKEERQTEREESKGRERERERNLRIAHHPFHHNHDWQTHHTCVQ